MISKRLATALAGLLFATVSLAHANSTTPSNQPEPFTALPKGSFSLKLTHTGSGVLPSDEEDIYIQIISQPCVHTSPCAPYNGLPDTVHITYVMPSDQAVSGGPNGSASLGIVHVAEPNMKIPSFKLSDLTNGNIILPGNAVYAGTRVYIAVGKELLMTTNDQNNGYVQTDFNNPNDPNIATPFDFIEIAYDANPSKTLANQNTVAFGANLTQVDQFALPLAFTVQGVSHTLLHRGITVGPNSSSGKNSRDELIQLYLNSVSAPYKALAQTIDGKIIRILAPYHNANFKPGGTNGHFFDDYVSEVWNFYKTTITDGKPAHTVDIYDQANKTGNKYEVYGDGTTLYVVRNGKGPYTIHKPSTMDVFQNSGNLQPGGIDIDAFGAMLSGALNRHVADQPQSWRDPSKYYLAEPMHDYASYWHKVSIDHLAYGFGFDDSAEQSSVAILSSYEDIASLNVEIGW